MPWTREKLSWVAGFLEGEVCFLVRKYKGNPTVPVMSVTSSDLDVIEKCKDIIGMGIIHKCKRNKNYKPHHKDMWSLDVTRSTDAYALMVAIYSMMGIRRQDKIRECILAFKNRKLRQEYLQRNRDEFGRFM